MGVTKTIDIPKDLYARLKKEAEGVGLKVSHYCRLRLSGYKVSKEDKQ